MSREYVLQPFQSARPLRIDYASELNGQQLAAVTASPGPTLVLAGAGSGKTRTLTYRVAWLIEHGVRPERILLLTFTNKAAREMMERVGQLLGGDSEGLWGGTFHSVANRILRRHADRIGYRSDFTIADREDTKELLTACLGEGVVDVTRYRYPKADALASIYSMASNTGRPLDELLADQYGEFAALAPGIAKVRQAFQERKRRAGMMDFDDLLLYWRDLLRGQEDIRELYQGRFEWVLVDEYQDTNHLQGELIDILVERHRCIMAVGDDAQSIYSWRGANFANILEFTKRYPGAQVHRVEVNYRSTPEILRVANAAIAANTRQHPKVLRPAREPGTLPALVSCEDPRQQAGFVAQRVLELREEGVSIEAMCVLYRSHFHAVQLQMELTGRNIPFTITSGIRFFEQAHIKDLLAYARLVHHPADELAFKRVVRILPGIGARTADRLWEAFHESWRDQTVAAPTPVAGIAGVGDTVPAGGVSDNDGGTGGETVPAVRGPDLAPCLAAVSARVPRKAAVAWAALIATLAGCEKPAVRSAPARLLEDVLAGGYAEHVKATYDNATLRLDDCQQLAAYAGEFGDLASFLSDLALQSEMESGRARNDPAQGERLRLSTVHQAKGLEFRVVFILMLADGMFPTLRSLDHPEAEEEERRLFYVAVTRAKDELYLIQPRNRIVPGGGMQWQPASRFLREIPPDLVEEWTLRDPWATREWDDARDKRSARGETDEPF